MFSYRFEIFEHIKEKYGALPEFLWRSAPDYAAFRHEDNKKWFALIMNIPKNKLGNFGGEMVDIINLKLSDPLEVSLLAQRGGFFKGYHISSGSWVSVLLDGSVELGEIFSLIDESYAVTSSAKKKAANRPPKEWIIPANPKYYDVVSAFEREREIDWKQGAGIKKGDTVYMYVGAPVSAILFRCKVTEADLPSPYKSEKINIPAIMRIRLERSYPPDKFTFETLKSEFGIYAVRGPRGIPNSLSAALKGR